MASKMPCTPPLTVLPQSWHIISTALSTASQYIFSAMSESGKLLTSRFSGRRVSMSTCKEGFSGGVRS